MTGYSPPHLSASAIAEYLRCPAHYFHHRVGGLPQPPTPMMLYGSVMGRALRVHHEGGSPLQEWRRSWEFLVAECARQGTEPPKNGLAVGRDLLLLYLADPAPDGVCEHRFSVSVPGLPVPLVGFLDLEAGDEIHEFKTALWPWGAGRVETEIQAWLYIAAWRLERGTWPARMVYTILSAWPSPALTRVPLAVDRERAIAALRTAAEVYTAIVAGSDWAPRCPAGRCDYPALCGRDTTAKAERRDPVLVRGPRTAVAEPAPLSDEWEMVVA